MGGKFHLKLNISERPIENKYREGKLKRTLKRELKGTEIAERKAESWGVYESPAVALFSSGKYWTAGGLLQTWEQGYLKDEG